MELEGVIKGILAGLAVLLVVVFFGGMTVVGAIALCKAMRGSSD